MKDSNAALRELNGFTRQVTGTTLHAVARSVAAALKKAGAPDVATVWVPAKAVGGRKPSAVNTVRKKTPVISALLPGMADSMYTERIPDTKPVIRNNNQIKVHLLKDELVVNACLSVTGPDFDVAGAAMALALVKEAAALRKKNHRSLHRSLRVYITFDPHALQGYLAYKPFVQNSPLVGQIDLTGTDDGSGICVRQLPGTADTYLKELVIKAAGKTVSGSGTAEENQCLFGLAPANAPAVAVNPDPASLSALKKTVLFVLDADDTAIRKEARRILTVAKKNTAQAGTAVGKWGGLALLVTRMEFLPFASTIKKLRKEKALVKGYLGQRNAFVLETAAWAKQLQPASPSGQIKAAPVTRVSQKVQTEADSLVPLTLFTGFWGTDGLGPKREKEIRSLLGIKEHEPVPFWVQAALQAATGKKPVSKIHSLLQKSGYNIQLPQLVELFRFLQKTGAVRFRPVIGKKEMLAALKRCGVKKGDTIVAHTGLASFGYIPGGPKEMIESLQEAIGPEGTLCMPAHSVNWVSHYPYDPASSRSIAGLISNLFIKWPGAIRSLHPTHSVTCVGPKAKQLTEGHDWRVAPQGKEGFWGKFVADGGKTVMFCGSLPSNTLLHAVDLWGGVPLPPVPVHFIQNGKRVEKVVPGVPYHTTTNKAIHEAMYRKGQIKTVKLGEELVYVMKARDAVATGTPVVKRNILKATQPGCDCRYCNYVKDHINAKGAKKAQRTQRKK